MGIEIDRDRFTPRDFEEFDARLKESLDVLESVIATPGFGSGANSLGAELEVALTDASGRPAPLNEAILKDTLDERMTVELDRFNLECNLRHSNLAGRSFAHLRRELESALEELTRAAALHQGRVEMIGILPTLQPDDFGPHSMTSSMRYRALSHALEERRQGPFELRIDGEDMLRFHCDDVTPEGAATSFQIHLRVAQSEFKNVFNAAQLATAPLLAAAGNSPTLLGHRLWDETRVALFKQAVDHRDAAQRLAGSPARVSFGSGWVESGPLELFREAVTDYFPLLPVIDEEDPKEALRAGRVPRLREIRLHQGTVWRWNRPVYDAHDEGHIRMELRALPSGPTIEDMLANTAFLVGLSLGLAPRMPEIQRVFDFEHAHQNFYRAAKAGLDAELEWPTQLGGSGRRIAARDLFPGLAPIARAGLLEAEVDPAETNPLIDLILARVEKGQTGAAWQRSRLAKHTRGRPSSEALSTMFRDYSAHGRSGLPVHEWPVE